MTKTNDIVVVILLLLFMKTANKCTDVLIMDIGNENNIEKKITTTIRMDTDTITVTHIKIITIHTRTENPATDGVIISKTVNT